MDMAEDIIDLEENVTVTETVDVIDASEIELFTVDSDEAFPALGEINENLKHSALYDRDFIDQHPIMAITGLRDELDEIESLKTVYSNQKNRADYYLWEDNNPSQENREGFFVSINQTTNYITKYDGTSEVFGVVINSAGFVGGQDDVARDNKYGLVAYDGLVAVRCESDVKVGNYVIPNKYGVAKKATYDDVDGKYGYAVVTLKHLNEVDYAEIILDISANQVYNLGEDVQILNNRVDDTEANITSAINVANEAYNLAKKIEDADIIGNQIIEKAEEAVEKAEQALDAAESHNEQIAAAKATSEEAKIIAQSVAASATAISNKAVEIANSAFAKTSELSDDLKNTEEQLHTDIENAELALQKSEEDLKALIDDTSDSIAEVKQMADDNGAQLATVSSFKYKDESGNVVAEGLAGIGAQVTANTSELNLVASYEKDGQKGLAGLTAQVDENKSSLSVLNNYEHKDEDGNIISNGATGLISQVDKNSSELETFAKFEQGNNKGVTGIIAQVNADASELSNIASHTYVDANGNETTGLAAINQQVTDQGVKIDDITSWQGETNIAIASIEQKADDNGASIEFITSNVDRYSVGEYSQAYGLTLEQATSILRDNMVYIPIEHTDGGSHSETYEYTDENGDIQEFTQTFTQGYSYSWRSSSQSWHESRNPNVAFTDYAPDENESLLYWYIDSNTCETGYEPYALYIWKDDQWKEVNILDGNVTNRITGMIRQTANEIALEVANARGSVASLSERVGVNETTIEGIVKWKTDPDNNEYNLAAIKQTADDAGASIAQVVETVGNNGEVNAASIVTAINNYESAITLNANRINLNGAVTANNNVTISTDGKITAKAGSIGGWTIGEDGIGNTENLDKGSGSGIWLDATPGEKEYFINCVNYSEEDKYFRVTPEGVIQASGGMISDWAIGRYSLTNGEVGSQGSIHLYTNYPNGNPKSIGGSANKTDWRLIVGSNFGVDKDGSTYASNIVATGGTIGGWTINNKDTYSLLYSAAAKVGVGMSTSGNKYDPAFWAGLNNWGNNPWIRPENAKPEDDWYGHCNFYVRHDGFLFANDATIRGKITATEGHFSESVTIGDATVTAGYLKNLYSYAVGGTGTAIKQIDANKGYIAGWTINETQLSAGDTYIASDGRFIFMPKNGSYAGFLYNTSSNKYQFVIGADCELVIGQARLTEDDLNKLKALI